MYEVKSDLIIKYNTVMDMDKYIRTIIAPYTAVVKNIAFDRINHPTQIFKLNYVDEKVMISVDWNMLRGTTLGKTSGLDRTSERFKDLYDIFSKIRSLESFNNVEYVKLITHDVLKDKYHDADTFNEAFTSDFISSSGLYQEDIGLILEGNNSEGIDHNIVFGPLNVNKDIKHQELNLFDINPFEGEEDIKGCLIRTDLTKKTNEFNSDIFKELLKRKYEIIQIIKDK